ncbi:MAG: hypothetical protein OXT09_11120 [Myxococcales bacterium]|nr:hypothetical protein [Myxococcales bacterium]
MYAYLRSTQLEGTYPDDAGCHIITAMRVAAGWGCLRDYRWPFDTSTWPPPHEPEGLDERAKQRRILFYQRVRTCEEVKVAIASRQPVLAAFLTTAEWDAPEKGVVPTPRGETDLDGGVHCVLLLSYDAHQRSFGFVNSWGDGWGDRGLGRVGFDYFERFGQEAWMMDAPVNLAVEFKELGPEPAIQWGMWTALGGVHSLEHYDHENDVRLAWALAREDGSPCLEVEELFVRPGARSAGLARDLCAGLRELSEIRQKPLRLWVPPIDAEMDPDAPVAVARLLELELRPSPVAWASHVGLGAPVWEHIGGGDEGAQPRRRQSGRPVRRAGIRGPTGRD